MLAVKTMYPNGVHNADFGNLCGLTVLSPSLVPDRYACYELLQVSAHENIQC